MGLMDMLTQAMSGGSGAQQFGQIAQNAPSDLLAKGLSAAFASDQTPAIGNMVGQLFGQSNGAQQAGMLNQFLGALGPGVMGGSPGGARLSDVPRADADHARTGRRPRTSCCCAKFATT